MTLLTLPRASIPVIDSKGYMSREWYRWATDATSRMGGVEGAGTDDLTLSQFEDAGVEELKQSLFRLSDAGMQGPPIIETPVGQECQKPGLEELRARVDELTKAVEALQQGFQL